jgi:hypothetical protein
MIDINKLITDNPDTKKLLKNFGILLLEAAADNAEIEWGWDWNVDDEEVEVPNGVDKKSITCVIDDVNFE